MNDEENSLFVPHSQISSVILTVGCENSLCDLCCKLADVSTISVILVACRHPSIGQNTKSPSTNHMCSVRRRPTSCVLIERMPNDLKFYLCLLAISHL